MKIIAPPIDRDQMNEIVADFPKESQLKRKMKPSPKAETINMVPPEEEVIDMIPPKEAIQ